MNTILVGFFLLASPPAQGPGDRVYEGTWVTTNRRLEGTLTCVVTDLGGEQWRGRFSGAWQRVSFAYTVDFTGPPEKLRGKAVIDGADYDWTGDLGGHEFKGRFTGNRYHGSFRLKEKSK